jgi:hypothetical protein
VLEALGVGKGGLAKMANPAKIQPYIQSAINAAMAKPDPDAVGKSKWSFASSSAALSSLEPCNAPSRGWMYDAKTHCSEVRPDARPPPASPHPRGLR